MNILDHYLSKKIKNLAGRKRAPMTGKARLLIAAQYANFQKAPTEYFDRRLEPNKRFPETMVHNPWTIPLIDLSMIYHYQINIVNPRLL